MYDIIFISRNNKSSELDFSRLKQTWPFAKTAESFRAAQKKSTTKLFWAVWPDVVVDINFNFDYRPPVHEEKYVHIWPNSADRNLPSVGLFPKDKEVTDKEIENRFFSGMIKMNTIASHTKYYDIVFIAYNEEYADENYEKLIRHAGVQHNNIHRIDGVKGIHQAHIAAAEIATTNMFWVVDADAVIDPQFRFNSMLSEKENDIVHVWRSCNPVNGLAYGNGGVKLLPRESTLNLDVTSTDMTTSISPKFKVMPTVSNITKFNTNPLNTWRSAFRECVKLSSGVIPGDELSESQIRLNTWLYQGGDKEFGEYAKGGASAGTWYGTTYKDDLEALSKINDYDWLEIQFNEHVEMFPPVETFKDLEDPVIEREREQEQELTQDEKINFWRSSFREAANSITDADRIQELLYNGINEYSLSGASAGKWWGETYQDDAEKMQQINDDKFLEGEFYWHTENNPVEQFVVNPLVYWKSAFREAANTTDADRLDKLLYRGINEYSRGGASAGKWFGDTYRNDPDTYAKIEDDSWLEGEFYYHIEVHPPETFK